MSRVFISIAAAVVVLQPLVLPPPGEMIIAWFLRYYLPPLVALLAYLLTLAIASRGRNAPRAIRFFSCFFGASLILHLIPVLLMPRLLELSVKVAGGVGLLVCVGWLAASSWPRSKWRSIVLGVGGTLGALVFLQDALLRYVNYFQSHSSGILEIIERAFHLTIAWGVAAAFVALGSYGVMPSIKQSGA